MGAEEGLLAVPVIILVVYVGWVILHALTTASPGFMWTAVLLMIAIVLAGIASMARSFR